MILDELALKNFGLYAGQQNVILTPPSASKPVVLIGGLNGGGKTTLLDALQLCLFGPHARTSNRGSLAYPEYLARCVHRGAADPEASVEIAFRHTVEGREERYRLLRSWRINGTGCKEQFEVIRNGRSEPALAESWFSQVEDLMPPNIAHLFLFDGEQIENYASLSNSSALIGSAVQNLLGLDIVDQLDKDLQVYEKRKRTPEKDDASRAAIDALDRELGELRERSRKLTEDRASLRSHKIDLMAKALSELDAQFRRLGGELYERRTDFERQLARASEEVDRGASSLRELAGGPMPLLLVRDLLKSVATRDRDEDKRRQARETTKVLKERDDAMLKHLRKQALNKSAIEEVRAYLEEDREKRATRNNSPLVLKLSQEARNDLQVLLRDELDATATQVASVAKQYQIETMQLERLQLQFDSIPRADAIADITSRRDALRDQISTLESEHAAMAREIERLAREIERKDQALSRRLEEGARADNARQDRSRILRHSGKVRETLTAFRRAVSQRHIHRIEQLVLESYKQLLRKASLVTRLAIDPENYSLTLYGRDDKVLSAERLSAGERQLLATALLWGLARASGRPLPTAIDTPLGRLDTDHRIHLVERYFPFASHQVMLLSTDEEIAGQYLARLEPWIGRTYRLAYDDETGQTRILPGYFGAREAA